MASLIGIRIYAEFLHFCHVYKKLKMWYKYIVSLYLKLEINCMESFKKSLAFTLAEVLIVLGIIGIVAALTIPTLMANVQKQQYVTALKKFYSTQTEGFARMLAEDNVEKLEDTEAFQAMPDSGCNLNDVTVD